MWSKELDAKIGSKALLAMPTYLVLTLHILSPMNLPSELECADYLGLYSSTQLYRILLTKQA
ncbi:hypothetical protein [Streptococcus merionis]|uniref:hypothetical protein n=1 Tax=Streptococcus merionis TaxID=400065 RepID=UPI0026ECAF56|nr:hypothetical protein [Streptococcus merionis]